VWHLEHLDVQPAGGRSTWLRLLLFVFLFFLLYSSLLPHVLSLLGIDSGGPMPKQSKVSQQQHQHQHDSHQERPMKKGRIKD